MNKYLVFAAAMMLAGPVLANGKECKGFGCKPETPSSSASAVGVGIADVDVRNTNVAGAIAASQSNNSVRVIDNSRTAASSAGAPSIGGGGNCGVGFSLGSSTFGQSAAAGFSVPGRKCVVREEASMLYNMGFKEQAIQHLINNDARIRRTFQQSSTVATSPRPQARGVSYAFCGDKAGVFTVQPKRGADPETAKAQCMADRSAGLR